MVVLSSIRSKLLLSYLVIITLPLGILGTYLVNRLGVAVANRVEQSQLATVRQLEVNLSNYLQSLIDISQQVYLNEQISFYLGRRYDNPGVSAIGFYELVRPLFVHYRYGRPGIRRLTIVTDNPTLLANGDEIAFRPDEPRLNSWYESAIEAPGVPLWGVVTGGYTAIRLYRSLGSPGPHLGMIVLDVDEREVFRFIREEPEGVEITIAAPNGVVVSSHDRARVGLPLVTARAAGDGQHGIESTIRRTFSLPGASGAWTITKTIPVDSIAAEVRAVTRFGVLASIVVFLAAVAISVPLSRRMTAGISRLSTQMEQLQRGDFSVRIDSPGTDEIGRLQASFNTMVQQLDRLIDTNYRSEMQRRDLELRRRDAELYALQSQIDPHFLFNTLEALVQGVEEGRPETAQTIRKLAQLTRKRLQGGRDIVQLHEELATVDEYLSILAFRLEDRLSYRVECPDECASRELPRFTIQPLVENAVVHGLAGTKHGGAIEVMVEGDASVTQIDVLDNGAGIAVNRLKQIRQSLSVHDALSDTEHIGLVNVYERLLLYYGTDASLEIDSGIGRGTRVTVRIPNEDTTDASRHAG